jgi:dihydrofolate reductase
MAKLILDITTSLDGFVAGPNPSLEQPLGEGGERLHEWAVPLKSWRQRHGLSGGETNASSEIIEEALSDTGAVVMGRRMFSGGEGPWEDDPNRDGWWGEDPPFRVPVFVLTHHPRERMTMQGGTSFTFVTDGIESALEQARSAAAGRNVYIGGGASVAQQYLAGGLLDELQVHVVPLVLGEGTRLFGDLGTGPRDVELARVVEAPGVVHLRFRVARGHEG